MSGSGSVSGSGPVSGSGSASGAGGGRFGRAGRWALAGVVLAELSLLTALLAGASPPLPLLLAAELAVACVVTVEVTLLARAYRRARRAGRDRRSAARAAVRATVPTTVRRLMSHETALFASILRRLARRPAHGLRPGDRALPYAARQAVTMYVLLFVCVVETVLLAVLIPWPVVHAVVLVLDVWAVLFVFGLHSSCVVRPHLVGADGALRVRYGALVDIRVPAGGVAAVRVERRFAEGGLLRVGEDGTVDLAVSGETTVTVDLAEPVAFRRPLGRPAEARTLRFYAEDPRAAAAALGDAVVGAGPARAREHGPARAREHGRGAHAVTQSAEPAP